MKKVLIVEDVEFNRDLLVQLLEDDYEVLTATDGAEGIQLATRERPDLILMDLSLPIIDGWKAARRIKANAALQNIPIIALSAHAMMGDQRRLYRADVTITSVNRSMKTCCSQSLPGFWRRWAIISWRSSADASFQDFNRGRRTVQRRILGSIRFVGMRGTRWTLTFWVRIPCAKP